VGALKGGRGERRGRTSATSSKRQVEDRGVSTGNPKGGNRAFSTRVPNTHLAEDRLQKGVIGEQERTVHVQQTT